jgi:hypothetical protein
MARCSSLDEASRVAGVEDMDEALVAAELERALGENPAMSPDGEDILREGVSVCTHYFGMSTITVGKIKEMEEKRYFTKDEAHAPGAETVPEPRDDEAMVYEDFFVAGLRMPTHLTLADILLHFQAQLHQLMPNAIAQLSKNFWAVGKFGSVPLGSVFAKHYELRYQSKTIVTQEGERIALNFHVKRDGSPKLSLAIKNKWVVGWTKSWFYCRVPCRQSSEGGKSMFALHSQMSELDYAVKPEVECSDDDPNDAAFVRAMATIGGRDVVEEYVACKMYPLATGFGFESVPVGMTPMSKVELPLPPFVVSTISAEHAGRVLAEVETEAERVLGSFGPREYDALVAANILNGGRLNQVLE